MLYSRAPKTPRGHRRPFICRALKLLAIALWLPVNSEAAQTNEFLPEEPTLWEKSVNLRTGFGYKDNLALSQTHREESPLVLSALDISVYRLPLDGKQVTFFVTGEDTRFLEGRGVKYEQFAAALAEFKMDIAPKWNAGALAQYIYQNQIFDVSTIEAISGPLRAEGHRIGLSPSIRWDFHPRSWLRAEPRANRQFFKDPLDDYWEPAGKLTFGYDYGFKSSISLGYEVARLIFDNREQLALDGSILSGHPLEFTQHEAEVSLLHNWDAKRRWRTTTRVGVQRNDDNGPGFFDYLRYQASQQIRYVDDRWDVRASTRASYYDFARQPATPSNPASRGKTVLTFLLRGDRKLVKRLKIFAEFEHERSLSNRPVEEYRVNRVVGGIDVEL